MRNIPLGVTTIEDLAEYLQTKKYLMLLPHHIRRPSVTDTGSGQVETYTGVMGNTYKERYNGHKSDIRHWKDIHMTCLADHIYGTCKMLVRISKSSRLNWVPTFNPTTRK